MFYLRPSGFALLSENSNSIDQNHGNWHRCHIFNDKYELNLKRNEFLDNWQWFTIIEVFEK